MLAALRAHWPEYLAEAVGLGLFMVSATVCAVALEHPGSFVRTAIGDAGLRRGLMGLAMGLTAVAIIYSRWGKRSGAHINPAVTLAFWRLGKIEAADAVLYVAAQFAGGTAGAWLAARTLAPAAAEASVNFVVTRPGANGIPVAFAAETMISFVLFLTVLVFTNTRRLNRFTGLVAGALVAVYIAFEAPVSGMSMNPARSFASAATGRMWSDLWIYFLAPPFGMLLAAELFVRVRGARRVLCAKLHHDNGERCIFRCRYETSPAVARPDGRREVRDVATESLGAGSGRG